MRRTFPSEVDKRTRCPQWYILEVILSVAVCCARRRRRARVGISCVLCKYWSNEMITSSSVGFRVSLHTQVPWARARIHSRGTQDARLKLWKLSGVPRECYDDDVCAPRRANSIVSSQSGNVCTRTTPAIICHSAPLCRPKTRNRVSRTST